MSDVSHRRFSSLLGLAVAAAVAASAVVGCARLEAEDPVETDPAADASADAGPDAAWSEPDLGPAVLKACNPAVAFGGLAVDRRRAYDYAPAAMIGDGPNIKLWWCGTDGPGDGIYYSELTPGGPTAPRLVLGVSRGAWDGAHVCDPSVIRGAFDVAGHVYAYALYYSGTHDRAGFDTQIGVAFSDDGLNWVKSPTNPVVRSAGDGSASYGAGMQAAHRDPATGEVALAFFDATDPARNVFVRSRDGVSFGPRTALPAPLRDHVAVGDLAWDAPNGTWVITTKHLNDQEFFFFRTSDAALTSEWRELGSLGQAQTGSVRNHNPGWLRWPDGRLYVEAGSGASFVYFGAGSDEPATWAVAQAEVRLGGGACGGGGDAGCGACLGGAASCNEACAAAGHAGGVCAFPGSRDPGRCCECGAAAPPAGPPVNDCSQCLGGAASCNEACAASGLAGGHCAFPGSADPARCCVCDAVPEPPPAAPSSGPPAPPPNDCSQCLGGAASCDEACAAAGQAGGACAFPGSRDPARCCQCDAPPAAPPPPPAGDCSACTGGEPDCGEACRATGQAGGFCAFPGSQDPARCCQCDAPPAPPPPPEPPPPEPPPAAGDCSLCRGAYAGCGDACRAAGHSGGSCAFPGSQDPARCCECEDAPPAADCAGCLRGHPDCDSACRGSGFSSGVCAVPGSQDPAACCACR